MDFKAAFPSSLATLLKLLGFLIGSQLIAATDQPHYDENWLKINQYSPVEGYESHGSYGWQIGAGVVLAPPQQKLNERDDTPVISSSNEPKIPTQIHRFFLTKGTPWPVDFGLSIARLSEYAGMQVGGHIQWTFFEEFQRPALAVRISRMETVGLQGLDQMQTDSAQLGISYGFWQSCNLSLGIGRQRSKLKASSLDNENAFGLLSGSTLELEKLSSLWLINLKINLFHPFLNLG
ncbi:MAG: hypothetical protein NTX25_07935, partial [Proteobacteria bacterium]|nr:hypothetical protein [Pseudomonadota bacterium]